MSANYRVVVGVDGTDGGHRALRWAVHEAVARKGTVQAVTTWTADGYDLPPDVIYHPRTARERAQEILTREVASVGAGTGVTIASEIVEGRAAVALTDAARDADLLVLGSHGKSHVMYTVLGSVSEACVRLATCPVVVIPAEDRGSRSAADAGVPARSAAPEPIPDDSESGRTTSP